MENNLENVQRESEELFESTGSKLSNKRFSVESKQSDGKTKFAVAGAGRTRSKTQIENSDEITQDEDKAIKYLLSWPCLWKTLKLELQRLPAVLRALILFEDDTLLFMSDDVTQNYRRTSIVNNEVSTCTRSTRARASRACCAASRLFSY